MYEGSFMIHYITINGRTIVKIQEFRFEEVSQKSLRNICMTFWEVVSLYRQGRKGKVSLDLEVNQYVV